MPIGTRTARKPLEVAGITWLSYQVGVASYALFSQTRPQGRIHSNDSGIGSRGAKSTFTLIVYDRGSHVPGTVIGRRFRSERTAAERFAREVGKRDDFQIHAADHIYDAVHGRR